MSKQQKEKKKKEKHPVRNFLIVLILLGMLFGGGFGLWRYGGFEWGYQDDKKTESNKDNTETTAAPVENSADETVAATEGTTEAKDDALVITVSGEDVKIGSDSFTDEGKLKDKIMAVYKEGIKIELVDDKAVKSAYDMAKKVLDDLKYDYSEKTN